MNTKQFLMTAVTTAAVIFSIPAQAGGLLGGGSLGGGGGLGGGFGGGLGSLSGNGNFGSQGTLNGAFDGARSNRVTDAAGKLSSKADTAKQAVGDKTATAKDTATTAATSATSTATAAAASPPAPAAPTAPMTTPAMPTSSAPAAAPTPSIGSGAHSIASSGSVDATHAKGSNTANGNLSTSAN